MAQMRIGTRNTAPLWKKAAIVLCAAGAFAVVWRVLSRTRIGFVPSLLVGLAATATVVWLAAKLLGVHLSLRSWD